MTSKKGSNEEGKIFLFALSTCIWCKKLRALLDASAVPYEYVYVDQLEGEERSATIERLLKYNSAKSFPTLVVGSEAVVGYQESRVKELLEKCPKKK
jgi:glutaredoxin